MWEVEGTSHTVPTGERWGESREGERVRAWDIMNVRERLSDISGPGEGHHNVNSSSITRQLADEEIEALIRWGAGPDLESETYGLRNRDNEL